MTAILIKMIPYILLIDIERSISVLYLFTNVRINCENIGRPG